MDLGPESLERELFRILDILEEAGIPHFLTGGHARNLYAEPRTSLDFDVVLDMRGRVEDEIRALFDERGYAVEGPLHGDLGRRIVLGLPNYEADLWLAPDTPVHAGEFERIRRIRYGDREIPVVDPTDFVLRKAINYWRVRGKDTDGEDAYHVLLTSWEEIDFQALLERAEFYRIRENLEQLIEKVRKERQMLEAGRHPEDAR